MQRGFAYHQQNRRVSSRRCLLFERALSQITLWLAAVRVNDNKIGVVHALFYARVRPRSFLHSILSLRCHDGLRCSCWEHLVSHA